MSERGDLDVVIAGGGLAGLCLALQLERTRPGTHILVAEKQEHPLPEAAHKVGESSVEVASHYFTHVLGLDDLLARETPKFGLRFFMSDGTNRDITRRIECGPSHFLHVPSFQIDRGSFENALAEKAQSRGIEFLDGCVVRPTRLGQGGERHELRLDRGGESTALRCRWLVDATGRASLLKKRLGLEASNRHDVNAVWFRFDHPIDPDDWSDDAAWRSRVEHPRRLSTNHFMGPGYWVWLIPLARGRTSVGIVADARLHSFTSLHTFEKALAWLDAHEPQCARVLRALSHKRMDFLGLKHYSHDAKQLFSGDRWCLTGESGAFVDPFYSPGSDFIGIGNGFACDLITRDLDGEDVRGLAAVHDQTYRSLVRTYLVTYHRQYPLMGDARVMTTKIIWDFVMYWGGIALIFFRGRLGDPAFMERVRPLLQAFAFTNIGMQAFFRRWARGAGPSPPPGAFVDYAELDFLAELNGDLLRDRDDDALLDRLGRNLELARALKREIEAEAAGRGERAAPTAHLAAVFAALRAPRPFAAPRSDSAPPPAAG